MKLALYLILGFAVPGLALENPPASPFDKGGLGGGFSAYAFPELSCISGENAGLILSFPETLTGLKAGIPSVPLAEASKILIKNGVFSLEPMYGGNVLPQGVYQENNLSWSGYADFHVSLKKQPADSAVISSTLTVRISFRYGGKYKGKGAYIADIRVKPLKFASANTGNMNLLAELPRTSIENCGVADNPTACIDLIFSFGYGQNYYQNMLRAFKFTLKGNGGLILPSGEILNPSSSSGSVFYP
ncbi:MAG: hypothetical protein HY746_09255 [Elusimicrobia bacterium]|nr:hypothetical protein [Elusimicrobiota bacterium]